MLSLRHTVMLRRPQPRAHSAAPRSDRTLTRSKTQPTCRSSATLACHLSTADPTPTLMSWLQTISRGLMRPPPSATCPASGAVSSLKTTVCLSITARILSIPGYTPTVCLPLPVPRSRTSAHTASPPLEPAPRWGYLESHRPDVADSRLFSASDFGSVSSSVASTISSSCFVDAVFSMLAEARLTRGDRRRSSGLVARRGRRRRRRATMTGTEDFWTR